MSNWKQGKTIIDPFTGRIPEAVCWNCGIPLDSVHAIAAKQRQARAGDWSVCIECGEVSVFEPTLQTRRPTAAERRDLQVNHPDTERLLRAAQEKARDVMKDKMMEFGTTNQKGDGHSSP